MASLPRARRHRSSTSRSNIPPVLPASNDIDSLVRRLESDTSRVASNNDWAKINQQLDELTDQFTKTSDLESTQDRFRRIHGFQALAAVLDSALKSLKDDNNEINVAPCFDLCVQVVRVLRAALSAHEGNRRYFSSRVAGNGWSFLETNILAILSHALYATGDGAVYEPLGRVLGSLITLASDDTAHLDAFKVSSTEDSSSETQQKPSENGEPASSLQTPGGLLPTTRSTFTTLWNPEALLILVNIYVALPYRDRDGAPWAKLRLQILQSVREAIQNSFHIRVRLHGIGILSVLLHAQVDKDCQQSERDCLSTICELMLRDGTETLEDAAFLFKQALSHAAARSLVHKTVAAPRQPPCIQFDLSAGHSSIELPALPQTFPPLTGYTLTVWFHVDSFDSECHTTLFGAFDTSQACFVLVYIEKDSRQLILQTSVTSPKPSVRFKKFSFSEKIWYHLALVHRPPKAGEPSRASLFVNGKHIEDQKCFFPQPPPAITTSNTSAPFPPEPARRRAIQAFIGTPQDLAFRQQDDPLKLRWSLANAHLFDLCVPEELIAVQHALGPSYHGNYQDHIGQLLTYQASAELNRHSEDTRPDKSGTISISDAIQKRGSTLLPERSTLLSISATSVSNGDGLLQGTVNILPLVPDKAMQQYNSLTRNGNSVVFNMAKPAIGEALARPYGTAVMTGNSTSIIPQTLDDSSWRLGGCLAIHMKLLESATTAEALLSGTKSLFYSIQQNWRNSEAMEKDNGYGVVALLLREKLELPTALTMDVQNRLSLAFKSPQDREELALTLLKAVLEFIGYNIERPERSMLVNPMAYRVFLLDFDTWRVSSTETQRLYYQQIVHFLEGNPYHSFNAKRFARMRIVRRLLDSMRVDRIPVEIENDLISALKTSFVHTATHHNHREIASLIAFMLQEARAGPSDGTIQRRTTLRDKGRNARVGSVSNLQARFMNDARNSKPRLSTPDLGLSVLEAYANILCSPDGLPQLRRFMQNVPGRFLLHVIAEPNSRAAAASMKIVAHAMVSLGAEFKTRFVDKNSGFMTIKSRLRSHWSTISIWTSCFAILFGCHPAKADESLDFSLFYLLQTFPQNEIRVQNPEILPTIASMLEAALRNAVSEEKKTDTAQSGKTRVPVAIMQFLKEVHGRSQSFRDFAGSSNYVQELLFVLYPIIASTDRLNPSLELAADGKPLTFGGQDVFLRPHSNSVGERPTILRSGSSHTMSEQTGNGRIQAPRRPSSFILVSSDDDTVQQQQLSAHFYPVMSPSKNNAVKIRSDNAMAETLLEVIVAVLIDQVCMRKDFAGFGLFLKVPPGYQEYQAYFESYVLLHAKNQLWNHLQLNQNLLLSARTLTNLARYCLHMAEAVFEGWFIDGAQPMVDFTGRLLEYLQQPMVASVKDVRLCSQAINTVRMVFLRIILLRLSELDEARSDTATMKFLKQLAFWQTILFSPENQELPFIRLIFYLLYNKLISESRQVRLASAALFRLLLVQKPTEAATILIQNADSEQRHLSTGLMKLASRDDEDLLQWIDDRRSLLDKFFLETLSHYWEEFVSTENQKTEDSAKLRVSKRTERLKQWQMDEADLEDVLHRFETSTRHWRVNIHAQERLKLQRAAQDQQETINHLQAITTRLDELLRQPCGLLPDTAEPKWQLDETEARDRMRMRIVRDRNPNPTVYQPKRKASERILPAKLVTNLTFSEGSADDLGTSPASTISMQRQQSTAVAAVGSREGSADVEASTANLLEGEFEMVEDPREDDEGFEDKNRKIMRSIQRGDQIHQIYNVSRIVGLEACEGILIVAKRCLYLQDSMFQRSDGEIVGISQAPAEERDHYVQMISGKEVRSQKTQQRSSAESARHWSWTEVLSISKRRFLFRDVAIEVFFTDGRSYLLTFMAPKTRDDVYGNMASKAPHVHSSASSLPAEDAWRLDCLRNPEETPQSFGSKFANVFNQGAANSATRRWSKGEISNFHYLMLINTLAGRTFNDLTQYPVFPWVLADYTSDELDLTDPRTFRDLSKPMGCQHPSREAEFRDRYQSFAEMGEQNPFHYGTHYSSAMIVTSYLIRLQPFVQSYLLLQGGVFDHADRLFDSIEKVWLSSSQQNMTDVRELTPEFFYLPEFLSNINGYDFGIKEGSGQAINDVRLPPWAKGDPHIFIAKHREALESDHVSEHLHEWIDLIFGYKQRGEAAFDATNVFHPLSYHGARDLDAIEDPVERLATIGIIHNFGQTPHQVFQRMHIRRETERYKAARLDTLADTLIRLRAPLSETHERVSSLLVSRGDDRIFCAAPCKLNMPPSGKQYVQWLFSDNSLRFFSTDTKKLLGLYEQLHIGPISTALFADSKTLITGGADCTIGVWDVTSTPENVTLQSRTYLFGHRTPISVLAASTPFSTLVSASTDGQVLLWDLNRYDCVRVLQDRDCGVTVQCARVNSATGHICLCAGVYVHLYTLNGHLLLKQRASDADDEDIRSCAFYEGVGNEWLEHKLLFTGHKRGLVKIWSLVTLADGAWHLQLVKILSHLDGMRAEGARDAPAITSILPLEKTVYTGDEAGRVWEWNCVQRSSHK